jgi:catechol-2,3-dioxygenase
LFVEDLDVARQFYLNVFGLPVFFENRDSAVFKFGETLVNLLKVDQAQGLSSPPWSGVARLEPASSSLWRSRTWTRCARGWPASGSNC